MGNPSSFKTFISALLAFIITLALVGSVAATNIDSQEPDAITRQYLPVIFKRMPDNPPPNPFLNHDFEQGSAHWTEYSANDWWLIGYNLDGFAHSGIYLGWLGGDNNEMAILSQKITISAAAPYLHFWYYKASEDICNYDYFYVGVNGEYFHNEVLCESTNTYGWVEKILDLSKYIGANKTVQFSITTDGSLNSNVYLDDVFMSNSAAPTPAQNLPLPSEPFTGTMPLSKREWLTRDN